MKVILIRKCDNEEIIKENVKEIRKNGFGNCIQLVFENDKTLTLENDLFTVKAEKDYLQFNYQMLGRLKSDCDYYLGCGNRSKKHLWYQDEQEHINGMKKLYNSFSDDNKPEWLTYEDILNYEKQMINNQ